MCESDVFSVIVTGVGSCRGTLINITGVPRLKVASAIDSLAWGGFCALLVGTV